MNSERQKEMSEWSEIGWMAHQSVLFIKYYYLFEWKCVLLLPLFLILRFLCLCVFSLSSTAATFSHSIFHRHCRCCRRRRRCHCSLLLFVCYADCELDEAAFFGSQTSREIQWKKRERMIEWQLEADFFPEKSTKSDCVFSATAVAAKASSTVHCFGFATYANFAYSGCVCVCNFRYNNNLNRLRLVLNAENVSFLTLHSALLFFIIILSLCSLFSIPSRLSAFLILFSHLTLRPALNRFRCLLFFWNSSQLNLCIYFTDPFHAKPNLFHLNFSWKKNIKAIKHLMSKF